LEIMPRYQIQIQGVKDIASAAARASLRFPISDLRSPQLFSMKSGSYQALIRYHTACSAAVIFEGACR
jgi:hypothetical protein